MERIYVTVRPKPLSPEDATSSPWKISGNSISISNQSTRFEFDRIFEEDCRTAEVYQARTKDLVAAAVRGFNGTVFAYGQTNSGKTHTMRGSDVEPGVIRLAVQDLFDIIQEDVDREFLLRMSYMEIYNEEINDLLAPEHRKLQIHENIERGIFVAGLKEEIVAAPEQVIGLMEFGESHRHIGETNMNVYSSRSHTIFRMIIESRVKAEDDSAGNSCDAVRVSVLNLVDLAGSERAAKTGAEGMRLKEGSHINKSLMTLGTVIKKLSEGVESHGGHVPYRDSKLTRILQPSLGGNANTAIICNITLAQIHADETKSSLQFASRALRVTNCAHVNEILTDAALLKRQKKEIEELRARLQGSHAEHFEEEILNLRNTLLQSELERERIALELQEEKKAQALRERRLQEQAKKIENLSSLVLNSSVDENRFTNKKVLNIILQELLCFRDELQREDKRRETWCPSVISRGTSGEISSISQSESSVGEPIRPGRNMGLPLPFDELVNETEPTMYGNCQNVQTPGENSCNNSGEECPLPDAQLLLNVTNRRKAQVKKKISLGNECEGPQREHEDLHVDYETQNITTKIFTGTQQHSIRRKSDSSLNESVSNGNRRLTLGESEAIVAIKQLQEQVKMLETEKSSIQQKLDEVIALATEQNLSAGEKYKEVCEELLTARREANKSHVELPFQASLETIQEDEVDSDTELLLEVQELISEVDTTRNAIESIWSIVAEVFKGFAVVSDTVLDLKSISSQNSGNLKSIICNNEKMWNVMGNKVSKLEMEKSAMYNESIDLHKQIQELQLNLQEAEQFLKEQREKQESEKVYLFSQIENLQKEITWLSSSSLAKEKETLRKELEKTKVKLKETDSKLKNAVQHKTKLEGEKAQAEREIKRLHGQKSLLERDISKRDSIAGRKGDFPADRRCESKVCDANKTRVHVVPNEQVLQDYQNLEVLAFEMETTIASLEGQLEAVTEEKEEALRQREILASEFEATNSDLNMLQEEVSSCRIMLAESESSHQKLEHSFCLLQGERDELAIQLSDILLELEEEKAIWSMKEKAFIESISEKAKLSRTECASLSKELSEVRLELQSCKEECDVLRGNLIISEGYLECERKCSEDKSTEIDQLKHDLRIFERERENDQNVGLELETYKEECEVLKGRLILLEENAEQQRKFSEEKCSEIDQLRRVLMSAESERKNCQDDAMKNMNERAKLRMRLRSTQAKLDAFRGRYDELVSELNLMDLRYKEAAKMLKEKLRAARDENLQLARSLAERDSK